MIRHVASVHEEEKPIKCDICDYRFSQKSQMKRHVASVHEEEKPFKCDICEYSFSQKSHIRKLSFLKVP
jgi:KRAB domain-containing zinc finger protein